MITYLQLAAGLVVAFGAGIVVGTGLTTRSIEQSFRRLAQQRRFLEERERATALIMERHNLCLTCPGRRSPRRSPAYRSADLADDD